MEVEADDNRPSACVGLGAPYGQEASCVLKILPEMDRDQAPFAQRLTARRDLDVGEPRMLGVEASSANTPPQVSTVVRVS